MSDDHQGALLPTTSSKANAQKWYTGSAPDIGSTVLHRLRARLRAGEPGPLGGAEISAEPTADLDDRAAWRQANPNLRVTEQTIASERLAMSDEQFARERLSISPDLMEAGGPFGSVWLSVCDPEAVAQPAMFALDINPERTAAAIVGVQADPDIVSVVDYRAGIHWAVERCRELKDKYKVPFAIDARGPAASLVDDLRRAHVRLVELDSTDMTRACGFFFDAVTENRLKVRTNDDLDRSVSGARKRPVGDAYAWGRKSSVGDISLLVAATAGYWAAKNAQPPACEAIVI